MSKLVTGACAVGATALAVYDGGLTYGLVCGALGGATYLISEGQAKDLDRKMREVKDTEPSLYAKFKAQRDDHASVSALIGITTIVCPLVGLSAILVQAVVRTAVNEGSLTIQIPKPVA